MIVVKQKKNKSSKKSKNTVPRKVEVKLSNNARSVNRSNVAATPHLSDCSLHYARALSNPFGSFSQLPCIPSFLALPSFKLRMQARGMLKVGTEGVGYLAMNPGIPYNNNFVGQYTTALYANDNYNPAANVGLANFFNDSPYSNAAPANGGYRKYRLVGGGVKVRYCGTELNRGGRVILYRCPGFHGITAGPFDGSYFLTQRSTNTAPSSRKEEFVSYLPETEDDLSYKDYDDIPELPSLLIYIDGAVPGTSWEFETVQYFEFIGTGATNVTKSHSDPTGLGAVIASLPVKVSNATPAVAEHNLVQKALSTLGNTFSGIIPTITSGIGTLLGGPVGTMIGSAVGSGIQLLLPNTAPKAQPLRLTAPVNYDDLD